MVGRVEVVRADSTAASGGGSRRGIGGRRRSRRESATVAQWSSDVQDDAECHGSRQDGGHACDDGLDGILRASWFHNEPKESGDHVNSPHGLKGALGGGETVIIYDTHPVEVEPISQHQFPR